VTEMTRALALELLAQALERELYESDDFWAALVERAGELGEEALEDVRAFGEGVADGLREQALKLKEAR
jgi:hypothetical protein